MQAIINYSIYILSQMERKINRNEVFFLMTFSMRVQFDNVKFTQKPTGAEIGGIKNRLARTSPETINAQTFKECVLSGMTFTPAVLIGGCSAKNFSEQQLFALDIDNEDKTVKGKHDKVQAKSPLTAETILERCKQWNIKPFFIYETFSSRENWQKFRIVFASETPVTDFKKAENIRLGLMNIFPECDSACKNADRIFFGGKNEVYFNENAVLDDENLKALERLGAPAPREKPIKIEGVPVSGKKPIKIKYYSSNEKLDELKRDFDLLSYIRQNHGGKERETSNIIYIDPCPVCGHKDDFRYYKKTNSFYCFSASTSDKTGGSIIDFLMYTMDLDKATAIKYFKYELCGIPQNVKRIYIHK